MSKQGRCFICFKSGHVCKLCPSAQLKSCNFCKKVGHHHRSISPQRFASTGNDVIPASVNISSETDVRFSPVKSTRESEIGATLVTSDVNFSHTLLASGEKVLLQTATVTVCRDTGSRASVRVLLDSASQRTFMTHQLARELNLSSQSNETLLVSTFGGKKPHNLNTYVVHFTVVTKQNTSILLHANVVPEITGPVQCGPLLQGDLDFLCLIELGQLADSVPETGNASTVDILDCNNKF